MQRAWLEYLLAFRSVTRQSRRSAFGVSAVTFGVVALILASGFIEYIFWATREGNIQTGLGHIQVTRPGYLARGHADPWAYLLPDESPVLKSLQQFPGVRAVAPRLAFSGLVSRGNATLSFIGEGVDVQQEREVSPLLRLTAGKDLSLSDPRGMLLGAGLAENLGVKVGESVILLASTESGGPNAVEGTIRGLFNTATKAYDDSALRVPLTMAQELLRVKGAHRWIVVLNDTEDTPRVLAAMRSRFAGNGLEFTPWYEMSDFYHKVVALLGRQIDVVKLIIAIIIVLSISNTMMMNVLERTAEIGTSMAVGRRRSQILRQFMYEGLTIGLIGGVLGMTLGCVLGIVISAVGIPMPPPPGMAIGYTGEILLTGPIVLEALLIALITSLLASVYPARRASRMQIVDALRHNH